MFRVLDKLNMSFINGPQVIKFGPENVLQAFGIYLHVILGLRA
jgi:hypothetical protein